MKKFVGTVNGKSYSSVEEFNEAVNKLMKNNDGYISISSYWTEISDEDKEIESEDENKEGIAEESTLNDLSKDEYIINDKDIIYYNIYDTYYVNANDIKNKINNATNKDEIYKNVSDEISKLNNKEDGINDELVKITDKISELKKDYNNKKDELKKIKASLDYYKEIKYLSNENKSNFITNIKDKEIVNLLDEVFNRGFNNYLNRVGFWNANKKRKG